MLYGLSSPGDAESAAKEKLRKVSQECLEEAYAGLSEANLAKMGIALREPDYGELLPDMLKTLDDANRTNPHYRGWARVSFNNYLNAIGFSGSRVDSC